MKRPNPWRATLSLINYAAVALATAAACDLYHHFADDPPDTWTHASDCPDERIRLDQEERRERGEDDEDLEGDADA